MKKKIFITFLIFFLLAFGFLLFRKNDVTVYIGIAKADLDLLTLQVSIDGTNIFNDSLINNPYKYELKQVTLNGGLHSLALVTEDGYTENRNVFILFDQHIVIEYYAPCKGGDGNQCFDVRNRFTKFRLE